MTNKSKQKTFHDERIKTDNIRWRTNQNKRTSSYERIKTGNIQWRTKQNRTHPMMDKTKNKSNDERNKTKDIRWRTKQYEEYPMSNELTLIKFYVQWMKAGNMHAMAIESRTKHACIDERNKTDGNQRCGIFKRKDSAAIPRQWNREKWK